MQVEPGGAERAAPSKDFTTAAAEHKEPDPNGKIARDTRKFIQVETAAVPPAIKAGEAVRVHVIMRPNAKIKAHWNNEVEPVRLWVNPPQNWLVDHGYVTVPNASQAVSTETRELQFEIRSSEQTPPGNFAIPAYALYYVCEDVNGVCLYRRQDIRVTVRIKN